MNQRQGAQATILNAKGSTGFGTALDVAKYRFIGIAIFGSAAADLTAKCQGSFLTSGDSALDFTAAASVTNLWEYISMTELNSGTTVLAGDTGKVFSGSGAIKLYKINCDELRTINFHVSAWSVGSITVVAFPIE